MSDIEGTLKPAGRHGDAWDRRDVDALYMDQLEILRQHGAGA